MAPLANATAVVEGEVVEVLAALGLAHVQTPEGMVYGINRQTPGVEFEALRRGQQVRCRVTDKFHRVLHADVLG